VQIVSYFLVGLLLITSFLMTLFILLHKGRGGGMSDMFGGGFSSSLGGSSLAEKNLDRLTIAVAFVWSASIIAVGILITAL
jgi:preprotein translocase subunit SecG